MTELPTLDELRSGNKRALARALAAIETQADSEPMARLLDAANAAPRAHVIGLTGPPGVGKSTLTNALIERSRKRHETVGVIAVDPSSRRTGGALLGDRARIATDPSDRGVYVRSMAARDRLGGLAEQTVAAMVLMRAVYDSVLVESVGIGQSESDISFVADTMLLCIQPGSGDSLQFMKAGVMEWPDIVVVTKADMAAAARRARADVEGALTLVAGGAEQLRAPVVLVSATQHQGLDELDRAIADHRAWLGEADRLARRRSVQEHAWVEEAVRYRFGNVGRALADDLARGAGGPFSREQFINQELMRRLRC
ncbi:MAG TPA: GTP-binding protein [Xanthobacteraceae bacterium]|nr:GTP-binding protein [Xanthobacteraceae bacterium]